jgi:hypothetical protein
VGELALFPAEVSAFYATFWLINVLKQSTYLPCDQIRLSDPLNPFSGL